MADWRINGIFMYVCMNECMCMNELMLLYITLHKGTVQNIGNIENIIQNNSEALYIYRMNVFDCLLRTTQWTFLSLTDSGYNTRIAKHVSTLCWHHLLLRCWIMKFQPLKTHWTKKRLWKFFLARFFLGGFLLSTVRHPGTQVQI